MESIDEQNILKNVARISTSKIEIDITAANILNRLEINDATTKTEHENPGIASIWKDEICRRRELLDILPSPEIPLPEDRPSARPTASDIFYCEALKTKLSQLSSGEITGDESQINGTNIKSVQQPTKKTFNLKQFLDNSVYPAECSQHTENILNASHIQDHKFSNDILDISGRQTNQSMYSLRRLQKKSNLDESIIDENLILSLSQKTSIFSADDTCKLFV